MPKTAPTARELEILSLVAQGLTDPQIGARLYLSAETVRTHVGHVRLKLEARTRAHAVAEAIRNGYLPGKPDRPVPIAARLHALANELETGAAA